MKAIRGLGGQIDPEKVAGEREALDYKGIESRADFLPLAYERESQGVAGDLDEVSKLSAAWPRSLLASIATNQAQHLVLLRQALGAGPLASVPAPFEVGHDARPVRDDCARDRPPLCDRPLLLAPPLAGDRRLAGRGGRIWSSLGQASGSKTSENLTLPGTGSTKATELLEENLPEQAYGSNPLVLRSAEGRHADRIQVRERGRRNGEAAGSAARRQLGGQPAEPGGRRLPQQGPHDRLHPGRPRRRPRRTGRSDRRRQVLNAAAAGRAAGLHTSVGGYVGQQLSKPSTEISEAIGLAAAIVILLFAFGTATAMMLPIVSAVIGLACALSIIRLLEHVVEVPGVASTLATMIGLGVGIDYALFIVTRHKLQLARRDGAARVDRPRHRDRGRRRRLRRLHGRDRALLARLRRHPAGQHARLHGGDRGGRRGLRRGDAAAGDARRARVPTSTRCGSSSARPTPTTSEPHGWRRWARRGRGPALALGDRRADRAGRPGAADLPARAGAERHQRPAQGHHLAPGLRRAQPRASARASTGRC